MFCGGAQYYIWGGQMEKVDFSEKVDNRLASTAHVRKSPKKSIVEIHL